ncbi:SusE domain-containing protein [Gaetbulibacter sp. M235]|uniref:SusE domain-containing protein n=1 Tax=Gaetbulibacter sp. M235 TaxID=3126510 RepID=UPI00374E82AF
MKNLKKISIFTLTAFAMLLLSSCDDTTDKFVVSETDPVTLSDLTITEIELDAFNTNNPAVTFNWTEADYGQQASINYSLELSADEAFTNSVIPATVNGNNTVTLSVSELNNAAGNAGLNPFEWATLYARVVSNLGTQNGLPVSSNSISFNVYPYFNYVFNDYYLVGDATAPNWNNNSNNPALYRDENNSNVYYYTGYFANGHFKVIETKGQWHPQYGTDDGSTFWGTTATNSSPEPERFPYGGGDGIPEGFYTFTMDFGNKTFTFEPFNADGIDSPTSLSIQGSSLITTDMTPLDFDGHIWYALSVHLVPGDLTFSADGTAWGSTISFSGVATANGGNIPVVVEDDYDVWFNDLTGRYIMIPLNL